MADLLCAAACGPAFTDFEQALSAHRVAPLVRGTVRTLQLNVGKRCNLSCHHCHVDAGPHRTEIMQPPVAERVLTLLARDPDLELLDVTGGAPELNPCFRSLVSRARRAGKRVMHRSNLTVLFEPEAQGLPEFLAEHGVELVASLPSLGAEDVDGQRGRGVFEKSIEALRLLNGLGYGRPGSPLQLSLVHNPTVPALPPAQRALEASYRAELRERFGLEFHHLLTITNMPVQRFARALERDGAHAAYMSLLVNHFNPCTLREVMCRSLVSVAFDGQLYDCDFNQAIALPLGAGARSIFELESFSELGGAPIATGRHCFGCTAGAGSSCSGALG